MPAISQCADILLKDDSGEARVAGLGADLALVRSQRVHTRAQNWDMRPLLEPLGYRQEDATAWYVEERVLLDDDETFIAGVATREPAPGPQGGYRTMPQDRPVLQLKD
jgi:hypothetical protein